jgi:putative FmdB family regulatory protein
VEDHVPTYQYACTACDHRFEAVQSFSDASLSECPECAGALRKVFSSVGIVFKGSGFYRTDSRAGSEAKAESNGSAKDGAAKNGGKDGAAAKDSGSTKDASSSSKDGSASGSTGSSSSSGTNSSSGSAPAPAAAS